MKLCHFLRPETAVSSSAEQIQWYRVMCGPGLMLCCLQASFPHYLNPSDRKLSSQNPFLEPSSKPAQVDMKGTFSLFCIVKIILSTPHLMLAFMVILMKHVFIGMCVIFWFKVLCINVFINVEMKSMISVVAPSPPLLSTHGQFTFFSPRGFRLSEMMSLSPGAYIHGTPGHDWGRLKFKFHGQRKHWQTKS